MAEKPVTAAVEHLAAQHEDLAHPDPVLREAAWVSFRLDLRAFLDDVSVLVLLGLDELLTHAYRQANRSLLEGHDGGEWWALLTAYAEYDGPR